MRKRRVTAAFIVNPFYEGVGTWVLTDAETGRKQHMAIWPPMTPAEFLGLARYHLRTLREPLPAWDAPTIRFISSRAPDDDNLWT